MLYATFQCEIVIQFQDFKYSTESAGPRDPQEEDDMVCACWVCCVDVLVFGLRSAVGVLGCGEREKGACTMCKRGGANEGAPEENITRNFRVTYPRTL